MGRKFIAELAAPAPNGKKRWKDLIRRNIRRSKREDGKMGTMNRKTNGLFVFLFT